MGFGGDLTYMYSGQSYPGDTWYYIDEGMLNFDTGSVIEDNATVTVATFSAYVSVPPDESHTQQIRSYNWGDTIATGDFVPGASLSALTLLATKAVTSATGAAYLDFVSETAAKAGIALTDYTRVVFHSADQVAGTAPTGNARVRWYDSDYTGTTRDPKVYVEYTVSSAPTVTSLATTTGPTAGGTSVVITGTGFTGASAVHFGATDATTYTVNSATQITATSPAHVAGTVDITVTTSAGTSATGAGDQFTYATAGPPRGGMGLMGCGG
jgi:hypothetical protein